MPMLHPDWFFAFKDPAWFLLFPPVAALLIVWHFAFAEKRGAAIPYSSVSAFAALGPQKTLRWRHALLVLRLLSILLLLAALARPQTGRKNSLIRSEGIDVMIALDISDSMRGEDLQPDYRLAVARRVTADFITKRHDDRIGLVIFGSEAFLQCPLTLDHGVLLGFLNKVNFIPELSQRTAIGMGVSTALLALKKSKAKSRVIILVTDGANNAGEIDPATAAELAKAQGVKVYAIGIGKPGVHQVMVTMQDPNFGPRKQAIMVEMLEEPLQSLSATTGGTYYNAQNTGKFAETLRQIDKLEKSEITTRQYLDVNEQAGGWLLAAFLLFLLENGLRHTRFRKLP